MKRNLLTAMVAVATLSFLTPHACGDTLVISGGRTITGTILQTNVATISILTDLGVMNYARVLVDQIKIDRLEELETVSAKRIPDAKQLIVFLAAKPWAANLKQIPATVIDSGALKNVPYMSFRCGDDYEMNIYGDPEQPAGVEVGIYRNLLEKSSARSNCLEFITGLLGQDADKEILRQLNPTKDLKAGNGLSFEITPPTAPDAYMGWWVSVYSEQRLDAARATTEEMNQISVSKTEVAKSSEKQDQGAWAAGDLKNSRPAASVLSFISKSGLEITNAEVRPYVEGVSLIWRDTNNGAAGIVNLADLPSSVRARFGYDTDKAAATEQWQQHNRAIAAQQPAPRYSAPTPSAYPADYSDSRSGSYGGRVFVRGYTRKDGTYVHSYTRRK